MGAVAPVAAVLPTPLPTETPNQIVQHFWYCHRTAMAILTVAESINWQTEDLSMVGLFARVREPVCDDAQGLNMIYCCTSAVT